jgi:hypothetical protein
VLRAIENGAWNDSLRDRLSELERRKTELTVQLRSAASPAPPDRLTADAAAIYRARVADLQASLNVAEVKAEAAEALWQLIETVVLTPDASAPDGLAAVLHGELATILSLASGAQNEKLPRTAVLGSQLSLVAGIGNHRELTPLRADCSRGHDAGNGPLHRSPANGRGLLRCDLPIAPNRLAIAIQLLHHP